MEKNFNIIITIILIALVVFVYYNLDWIADKARVLFKTDTTVALEKPNNYKKNFTFKKYKVLNNSNDYIPYNKIDLENIMFNVFNNGYTKFTINCPEEYKKCKDDLNDLSNSPERLSSINNYVSPFNTYKNVKMKIFQSGKADITIDRNYTDEEIKKTEDEINNIVVKLNLNNYNDLNKIIRFHNYIISNSTYDFERVTKGKSDYSSNKTIGPLFEKKAICSGLTDVMAAFLDRYNIPNFKVATDKHIWNYAYVNGKWTHIDLTWDMPTKNSKKVSSSFLFVTTEKLLRLDKTEHNFNRDYYLDVN